MNFVIREIVTSAVAGYVEEASIHGLNESTYEHDLIRDRDYLYFSLWFTQENLTVKEDKISTTQTEDELKQSFLPGNSFGFNVELELVNEETEAETVSTEAEV